jgi:dCMP deaminase
MWYNLREHFVIGEDDMKRADYISWDEYFMGLALLSAKRSKDPSTQVGASIVNAQNRIMSVGYNGMPCGCSDDEFPWEREGEDTKYLYVCHAELNAILNSGGRNLEGCRIYTALFPCNNCAKAIIQSGIKEVCYLSDKYSDKPDFIAARRMFNAAGVRLRRLKLTHEQISLDLREESV